MKNACTLIVVAGCIMVICGCGGSSEQNRTGFLSDYSKLRASSNESFRYVDQLALDSYPSFIVDDVKVHFVEGASAIGEKSQGQVTKKELEELTDYFHSAIVKVIIESGHKVVNRSGPDVARLRVALTDVKETDMLNVIPIASATGVGVGSAAMEAELVDSKTGRQIAALVEMRRGSRIPFTNLGNWSTAKSVMDHWANRLKERLR